jgi:broad specificity phosphatase PhoE
MTAVRRLYLVRHAGTVATRHAGFPLDEPLAPAALAAAAQLSTLVPGVDEAICSPMMRARQTAAAAGWKTVDEHRLAPLDLGLWSGRDLQQIGGEDPAGMVRWLSDPAARPHAGETVLELIERIRGLLAQWHEPATSDVVAVTHAAVIRAAVVVALGAPAEAFWRVEIAPASVTELHTRGGGWSLFRANATTTNS